ncbi:putative serine carboxypeptidase-like 52 [Capsicum annuum]|nr:putative serine carboxypeptidase-like 52 [Capsicum annuum]
MEGVVDLNHKSFWLLQVIKILAEVLNYEYEGPITFEPMEYNGSLPTMILNPYSWTKTASIIFLDLPVGTGFSYATTPTALQSSDLQASDHAHQFLHKWFVDHPEFLSNPLYVGGDSSYADWYKLSYHWADDGQVRDALSIRKGTIGKWDRCATLQYQKMVINSIPYHENLSSKGYSGDHDKVVTFRSTQAWIKSFNYYVLDDWRTWTLDNQVAGLGAGHTAPECLDMLTRSCSCLNLFNADGRQCRSPDMASCSSYIQYH